MQSSFPSQQSDVVNGGTGASNDFPSQPVERTRDRQQRQGTWSSGMLKLAVEAVEQGGRIRTTARHYGIPASSLRDHLYGRVLSRKRGREGILTKEEEADLEQYLLQVQDLGYPLTIAQLRLKVAEMVQTRVNPFRDGIPGAGWLRWWRHRHPNLVLRSSQGLETNRARGLCPENVNSFYHNLNTLYAQHGYASNHIWNCDETGAQAGRNGGGTLVFAKRGTRSVHSIIPDQREWLSVLACINAAGEYIPHFYIFRGKRMRRNYLEKCDANATMAMQAKAWMTAHLFSSWISHFVKALENHGGISPSNRHLLVLDGHGSHVTLEVVHKASSIGLDVLTLPSHTSHRLQPLDVSIFRPFKFAFRGYRDAWTLRNRGRATQKEDLAQWVDLALKRALTTHNIQKGFSGTGIWPYNPRAMDGKMGPSQQFVRTANVGGNREDLSAVHGSGVLHSDHSVNNTNLDIGEDDVVAALAVERACMSQPEVGSDADESKDEIPADDAGLQELLGDRVRDSQAHCGHFFVENPTDPGHDSLSDSDNADLDATDGIAEHGPPSPQQQHFFQLPEVSGPAQRRRRADPIIDYSKSIIMTSADYLRAMEEKARLKEEAEKAKELKKKQAEVTKQRRAEEKKMKEVAKIKRSQEAAARKAFNERWSAAAVAKAGDDLHRRIKALTPPLPGQYIGKFLTYCPPICRQNQKIAMARLRAKRERRPIDQEPRTTPPPWAHRADPEWRLQLEAFADEDDGRGLA